MTKKLSIYIIRIVIILFVILSQVIVVSAETSVNITITAIPIIGNGITGFTITYVNDQRLDLSWGYSGSAVNIMIRSKYNGYPANIPNEDTAPSDGNLVYYGNAISFSDTSMDFDEAPGTLYYTAWAQKADGKWIPIVNRGSEESRELILLSFILLVIGLIITNVVSRNSFTPLRLVSAFAWAIPIIWVVGYPPSFITAGSNIQTAIIVVLIGMFLISLFASFRGNMQITTGSSKGGVSRMVSAEGGGWSLPSFMQQKDDLTRFRERRGSSLANYRETAHRALYGAKERDRFGRYKD